jgi:hypothetical protein
MPDDGSKIVVTDAPALLLNAGMERENAVAAVSTP